MTSRPPLPARILIPVANPATAEELVKLGADLLTDPTLAFSAQWCLPLAAEEWTEKGCNALADADDVKAVTKRINGGTIGLAERIAWLAKTKAVWVP